MDLTPQVRETKTKLNKWDLIKLKRFCTVKEIIDKRKRQFNEWEKIIAKDMSDKRLTAKIYKQLKKFNIKTTYFLMGRRFE